MSHGDPFSLWRLTSAHAAIIQETFTYTRGALDESPERVNRDRPRTTKTRAQQLLMKLSEETGTSGFKVFGVRRKPEGSNLFV